MENQKLTIEYSLCAKEELSPPDLELVEAACSATYTSYAPYSHFYVGAAVRLDNGEVVTGSNQENAAFGAGTCAERTALFYANANHPNIGVHAIAVAARGSNGYLLKSHISPCGVCRQALIEVQKRSGHPVRVLLVGEESVKVVPTVSHLLPFQFDEIE